MGRQLQRIAASVAAILLGGDALLSARCVTGFAPSRQHSFSRVRSVVASTVVEPTASTSVEPPTTKSPKVVKKKRNIKKNNPRKRASPTNDATKAKAKTRQSGAKGPRSEKRPAKTQSKSQQQLKRGGGGRGKKNKTFKPLKDLKLGSTISGRVVDVCPFGAFVQTNYAIRGNHYGCALLHISQIQDERIDDISSVIKVGQMINDARVITVDSEKGEVGLSLRKQRSKRFPLSDVTVGDELRGTVESVAPYGAFIDVGCKVNALLHISRITGGKIENIRSYVNEGDEVVVHIIDVDSKKKTMAASMLEEKADQYLDRRRSQRLKRMFGTAKGKKSGDVPDQAEMEFFDEAIKELEEALKG